MLRRVWVGDVIEDRFVIERPAGSGGMGSVFFAVDRTDGRSVAVKVLRHAESGALDRFRREARVLSELAHPCIVRYVAHGETPDREPFLAMEWLEGEDLRTRLATTPLAVVDALVVARRIADGLAHAHARGVVHRDVKPSNVLLVDGDPRRTMLIDFGVARVAESRAWTRTGTVLGTVGYMAPEQARGEEATDARADVFGLGCVLFECLTGKPAFSGPHEIAVLAKLLAGETPRLAAYRPDLGSRLDELLTQLLAQDPAMRPKDAAAVRDALDTVDMRGALAPTVAAAIIDSTASADSQPSLAGGERSVRSVLLAEPFPREGDGSARTPDTPAAERGVIEAIARKFGAELTWLPSGRLLFAFGRVRSAMDLAALAAASALELRARMPGAKVAIATGTADTGSDVAIGPVIDRVALQMVVARTGRISLDEVTAGLLPARFVVSEQAGARVLERAVALDDEPRPLMGRRTPCVGRERELGMIEGFLDACIAEPLASAVIVVGDAGVGKTRLRQEFVVRARKRHPTLTVLFGRGELVAAGSPLAVVRQLVRSGFELTEATPTAEASRRIRAKLERILATSAAEARLRVGEFIGELVSVSHPEPPSIPLQASREDARLMSEWLRRSFVEWLGAVSGSGPALVVIDDLHWADGTSLAWLDEVLRAHAEAPLGVLGLGRPELRDRLKPFPEQQEIALTGLRRRAAEGLVRTALPLASEADMKHLVEQSGGNVFYLEELARHFASGASDLPPTVLAMAQARLEDNDPAARAVLRAASVFGERFWTAGVEAILGDCREDARRWLELLASDELVSPSPGSRFGATDEYVFRHAVVREAAYASLTEADRSAAHLLAARWLEQAGEKDPMVMIDHFERAGAAGEGFRWYVAGAKAATASAGATSPVVSIQIAERGLRFAEGDPDRGALLAWLSYAQLFDARLDEARVTSVEALELTRPESPEWLTALTTLCSAALALGDSMSLAPYVTRLLAPAEDPGPSLDGALCLSIFCFTARSIGEVEVAEAALARLERIADTVGEGMPLVEAVRQVARAISGRFNANWFPLGVASARRAVTIARAAGHRLTEDFARVQLTRHGPFLGDFETTRADLQASLVAQAFGMYSPARTAMLAVAENDMGAAESAFRDVTAGVNRKAEVNVRPLLALLYADATRLEEAVELVGVIPPAAEPLRGHHADFHMARGRIALARGDAGGALIHCDEGDRARERWGSLVIIHHLLDLTRAEALMQAGRTDEAKRALAALRARILHLGSRMDEPTRASYLARGFPSARILRVAKDWLGDA